MLNEDRVDFDDIVPSVTLRGALFGISFWRVVLDESHCIKVIFLVFDLLRRIRKANQLKRPCFSIQNTDGA